MNRALERRAHTIAESFRELDRYSPTRKMIKHLIEQGKIDVSKAPSKARGIVMDYFLKEGLKYNLHIPFFFKKEGKVSVQQERIFESFVLSNIFANFLRGIDQYPAGLCMYEHGFEQFSVFCHYTSVYQLVNAVLSLHGICFVANPISGQAIETVSTGKTEEGKLKEIVKISFTHLGNRCLRGEHKSGRWQFLPCGFSHEERWKRFAETLKRYIGNGWVDQIPNKVKRYYGYLKVIEEIKEARWKPRKVFSIDFKDLDEFKRILTKSRILIPKIRNESVYKNIRYDAAERVHVNQGLFPQALLDAKMEILREFNEAMIDWVYRDTKGTLSKVKEILGNDSLYFRILNTVTSNPIIEISDLDLKRIQESPELDRINKSIKEIIPLILPPDKVNV